MTGVIVGLGPVAQQDGEVVERAPSRTHVPVDHRDRREAFRVEQYIVELEVVVHERHRAFGHDVVLEPLDDAPDDGPRLIVVGAMRALRPARDLAGEKPVRAAEGIEARGAGVHAVQPGERVHEVGGNPRRPSRLPDEGGRKLGPDGYPRAVLHEKERRAQDRRLFAQVERTRRQRKRAPEPREHPILADHVVCSGRQRPRAAAGGERRAARPLPRGSCSWRIRTKTGAEADPEQADDRALRDGGRGRPSPGRWRGRGRSSRGNPIQPADSESRAEREWVCEVAIQARGARNTRSPCSSMILRALLTDRVIAASRDVDVSARMK